MDDLEQQSQEAKESEVALKSEGQRKTSILWEATQRQLALTTTYATLLSAGIAALFGKWIGLESDVRIAAFIFLYGVTNLVIGFYFGRTNHQRVGGPGGDSAGER